MNFILKYLVLLLSLTPVHLLVNYYSEIKRPKWLVQWVNQQFVSRYDLNISEAVKPLEEYESLMELFTRKLKSDSRSIEKNPKAIVSPSDGLVIDHGIIENARLYQIKGKDYSLEELLYDGNADTYEGGRYITIYLSPKDYHRVHHGIEGKLKEVSFIPGRLLPVNFFSLNNFKDVFSKNKRMIFHYEENLKMIMVGAMNVGKMKLTNFEEEVFERELKSIFVDKKVELGDEAGIFYLGSTVILLFEKDAIEPFNIEVNQRVQMGQLITQWNK